VIVLCCIGIGYCDCGSKYCSTWSDYFNNEGLCRTKGGVDKATMITLSWIPLTGFSSFYSGKQFDGIFEALHGISTMILFCVRFIVMDSRHNDCTGCGRCMINFIIVFDIVKMVEDLIIGNWVELIIIIISFILSGCSCNDIYTEDRIKIPRAALILTASLAGMEWIKHIVNMRLDWELDVNGCKLL